MFSYSYRQYLKQESLDKKRKEFDANGWSLLSKKSQVGLGKGSLLVFAFVLGPDAPFLAGFPAGRVLPVTLGGEQIPDLQWRDASLQIPILRGIREAFPSRGCPSATSIPPAHPLVFISPYSCWYSPVHADLPCLREVPRLDLVILRSRKTGTGSSGNDSRFRVLSLKEIPQQMNGSDCGMFACKYADCITKDKPINFTQVKPPPRRVPRARGETGTWHLWVRILIFFFSP